MLEVLNSPWEEEVFCLFAVVHSCSGVIRVQQVTGHDDSDGGDDDGKIKPSSLILASRRRLSLFPSILRSCWRYRGRAFTRERERETQLMWAG